MASKSLEEEVRDEMYRLKLQMVKRRMVRAPEKGPEEEPPSPLQDLWIQSKMATKGSEFDQRIRMIQIESELQESRRKYDKMRHKLKEQELEKKVVSSVLESLESQGRGKGESKDSSKENFSQFLELMVLQQSQTQGLVLNHLLLRDRDPENTPQAPTKASTPPVHPQAPPSSALEPVQARIKERRSQPYPGNESQRTLRRVGLAALFLAILQDDFEHQSLALADRFLFEVKIKEVLNCAEKLYTDPSGEVSRALAPLLGPTSSNLKKLVPRTGTNDELVSAEKDLNSVLQAVSGRLCDIMPGSGSLGTEGKSLLSELLYNKQRFPDGYFLVAERELIQLDPENRTLGVGFLEAQALVLGLLLLRALVMHVILKPLEYNLSQDLDPVSRENLRVLGSVMVLIYRSILVDLVSQRFPGEVKTKTSNMDFSDLGGSIMSESELQPLLKVVKKSIEVAKSNFSKWAQTYVTKLRPP